MTNNKQFYIVPFLIALLIFLLMQPYFMWHSAIPIDFVKYAFYFIALTQIDLKGKNFLYFIFLFAAISIIPISHGNNIFGVLMYSLVAIIPFLKRDVMKETFNYFRNIYVIIILFSLLVWLLVILGFSLPSKIVTPLNELKSYNYLVYPMLAVGLDVSQGAFAFAFSGPFDERGVIGTISLILLYINNINLRDWKNIVLFVSGLVSFSLFFYVGIMLFYILTAIKNKQKRVSLIKIIVIISGFIVCIMSIPFLFDLIGSRLIFDTAEGKFSGDNRTITDLNDYIASIRFSREYFFGAPEFVVETFAGQANIFMAVLNYGALFILLYFWFYFSYARREFGSLSFDLLSVLVVMLCVLYQRPGFLKVEYLFLFTCCIILQAEYQNKIQNT